MMNDIILHIATGVAGMALGYFGCKFWRKKPKALKRTSPIPDQIPSGDLYKIKKFMQSNKPTLEQTRNFAKKNCMSYVLIEQTIEDIYSSFKKG